MGKVLDWRRAEDLRDVVHLSVQALVEGHLVAFPTETSYEIAASAIKPEAIERLTQVLPPDFGKVTLMMRSASEALDFAPDLSPVAKRIASRGWPGPLALEVADTHADSLVRQLPEATQALLSAPDGRVALRLPQHDAVLQVAKMAVGPLIMVPARTAQGKLVVAANQLNAAPFRLIVDDGLTQYQGEPTVVRVDENRCRIVRPGVLEPERMTSYSQLVILLVCTGNTCRSPMAQTMLQAKLRAKFPKQFEDNAVPPAVSYSAGISAMAGSGASIEAVNAMQEKGLDLSRHKSTPLNQNLVESADLILTMTNNHRQAILGRWPHLASKTFPIGTGGREISDPYGGPLELYRACANQLEACLDAWLEKIDESMLPVWTNDQRGS
jgi:protein-tyrosine phosphatase